MLTNFYHVIAQYTLWPRSSRYFTRVFTLRTCACTKLAIGLASKTPRTVVAGSAASVWCMFCALKHFNERKLQACRLRHCQRQYGQSVPRNRAFFTSIFCIWVLFLTMCDHMCVCKILRSKFNSLLQSQFYLTHEYTHAGAYPSLHSILVVLLPARRSKNGINHGRTKTVLLRVGKGLRALHCRRLAGK